jgi:hypothetical protein
VGTVEAGYDIVVEVGFAGEDLRAEFDYAAGDSV